MGGLTPVVLKKYMGRLKGAEDWELSCHLKKRDTNVRIANALLLSDINLRIIPKTAY
jgi:hypothetical protein